MQTMNSESTYSTRLIAVRIVSQKHVRRLTLHLLVGSIMFFFLGCSGESQPPSKNAASEAGIPLEERPPGHQKMVAELKRIADQAKRHHPLLGDQAVRDLRLQAALLTPNSDPFQFVFLHSELGSHELRLDNLEKAIEHLETAVSNFDRVPQPDPEVRQRFRNRLMFTLGTAWVRFAETQNCCAQYNADSCIVPIQKGGLHTNPRGITKGD